MTKKSDQVVWERIHLLANEHGEQSALGEGLRPGTKRFANRAAMSSDWQRETLTFSWHMGGFKPDFAEREANALTLRKLGLPVTVETMARLQEIRLAE